VCFVKPQGNQTVDVTIRKFLRAKQALNLMFASKHQSAGQNGCTAFLFLIEV
jgi:hypothetical protein